MNNLVCSCDDGCSTNCTCEINNQPCTAACSCKAQLLVGDLVSLDNDIEDNFCVNIRTLGLAYPDDGDGDDDDDDDDDDDGGGGGGDEN